MSTVNIPTSAGGYRQSIVSQAQAAQRQVNKMQMSPTLNARGFTQPLGRITNSASEFQKSMDASAARVFAFGAAVGVINGVSDAFKSLVQSAAEVEKALKDVQVVMEVSNSAMQKFGDGIFDVARNTATNFQLVANSAIELARQGLSAEETLARVNSALILSRLSGLDTVKSTEALTAAINSFNKEGITHEQIVNRMANVDSSFAVSSADLAQAISRAGAVAQSAGVSFNELAAIVTAVQQRTARGGSVIGNGFKSIFTRIKRSGVRQALEEIGVVTKENDGTFRSSIEILKDYANIYQTLSDGQKAYTSEQIAGVFQIQNLQALIQDLNSDYSIYNKALGVANNTTDEATKRNQQLNTTLSAAFMQASLSAKELAASIGDIALSGNFKDILSFLNNLAQGINDFLSEDKGSELGRSLVRGIGNFLTGPGLVILGAAFIKIFGLVAKFAKEAFADLLGINKEAKRTQSLQAAIGTTLATNNGLYQKILASSGNTVKQEQILLNLIKQETAERVKQEALVRRLAASGSLRGIGAGESGFVPMGGRSAKRVGRKALGLASGFLPAMSKESSDINQGVGGARRGDRPVPMKINTSKGKSQPIVANTGEYLVKNYLGSGGDAIFNRDMIKGMGMPEGAKKINASSGFVPNFAKAKNNLVDSKAKEQLDFVKLVTMLVPGRTAGTKTGLAFGPDKKTQYKVKFASKGPNEKAGKRSIDATTNSLAKKAISSGASAAASQLAEGNFATSKISKISNTEAGTTKGRIQEKAIASVLSARVFKSDTSTFDFLNPDPGKGNLFDWNTPFGDAKPNTGVTSRNSIADKIIRFFKPKGTFGSNKFKLKKGVVSDVDSEVKGGKISQKLKDSIEGGLDEVKVKNLKRGPISSVGKRFSNFPTAASGFIPNFARPMGGTGRIIDTKAGSEFSPRPKARLKYIKDTASTLEYEGKEISFLNSQRKGDANLLFDKFMKQKGSASSVSISPQRLSRKNSKTNFEDLVYAFPQLQYRLKKGYSTSGNISLPNGESFKFNSLKDLKKRVNEGFSRNDFKSYVDGKESNSLPGVRVKRLDIEDLETSRVKSGGDDIYKNYTRGLLPNFAGQHSIGGSMVDQRKRLMLGRQGKGYEGDYSAKLIKERKRGAFGFADRLNRERKYGPGMSEGFLPNFARVSGRQSKKWQEKKKKIDTLMADPSSKNIKFKLGKQEVKTIKSKNMFQQTWLESYFKKGGKAEYEMLTKMGYDKNTLKSLRKHVSSGGVVDVLSKGYLPNFAKIALNTSAGGLTTQQIRRVRDGDFAKVDGKKLYLNNFSKEEQNAIRGFSAVNSKENIANKAAARKDEKNKMPTIDASRQATMLVATNNVRKKIDTKYKKDGTDFRLRYRVEGLKPSRLKNTEGQLRDRMKEVMTSESNKLASTLSGGGVFSQNNPVAKKLANAGSVGSAAGTIFETAMQTIGKNKLFTKNNAGFDVAGVPDARLQNLFGYYTPFADAKIGLTSDTKRDFNAKVMNLPSSSKEMSSKDRKLQGAMALSSRKKYGAPVNASRGIDPTGVQRSFQTEKSLGGDPVLDFNSSIGPYVRDKKTQKNFADVKRDHPEGMKAAIENSRKMQGMASRGYLPNFAALRDFDAPRKPVRAIRDTLQTAFSSKEIDLKPYEENANKAAKAFDNNARKINGLNETIDKNKSASDNATKNIKDLDKQRGQIKKDLSKMDKYDPERSVKNKELAALDSKKNDQNLQKIGFDNKTQRAQVNLAQSEGKVSYLQKDVDKANRLSSAANARNEKMERTRGRIAQGSMMGAFVAPMAASMIQGDRDKMEMSSGERTAQDTLNMAGMGAMFGPKGMLIGAAAGAIKGYAESDQRETMSGIFAEQKKAKAELDNIFKDVSSMEKMSQAIKDLQDQIESGDFRGVIQSNKNISDSIREMQNPELAEEMRNIQNSSLGASEKLKLFNEKIKETRDAAEARKIVTDASETLNKKENMKLGGLQNAANQTIAFVADFVTPFGDTDYSDRADALKNDRFLGRTDEANDLAYKYKGIFDQMNKVTDEDIISRFASGSQGGGLFGAELEKQGISLNRSDMETNKDGTFTQAQIDKNAQLIREALDRNDANSAQLVTALGIEKDIEKAKRTSKTAVAFNDKAFDSVPDEFFDGSAKSKKELQRLVSDKNGNIDNTKTFKVAMQNMLNQEAIKAAKAVPDGAERDKRMEQAVKLDDGISAAKSEYLNVIKSNISAQRVAGRSLYRFSKQTELAKIGLQNMVGFLKSGTSFLASSGRISQDESNFQQAQLESRKIMAEGELATKEEAIGILSGSIDLNDLDIGTDKILAQVTGDPPEEKPNNEQSYKDEVLNTDQQDKALAVAFADFTAQNADGNYSLREISQFSAKISAMGEKGNKLSEEIKAGAEFNRDKTILALDAIEKNLMISQGQAAESRLARQGANYLEGGERAKVLDAAIKNKSIQPFVGTKNFDGGARAIDSNRNLAGALNVDASVISGMSNSDMNFVTAMANIENVIADMESAISSRQFGQSTSDERETLSSLYQIKEGIIEDKQTSDDLAGFLKDSNREFLNKIPGLKFDPNSLKTTNLTLTRIYNTLGGEGKKGLNVNISNLPDMVGDGTGGGGDIGGAMQPLIELTPALRETNTQLGELNNNMINLPEQISKVMQDTVFNHAITGNIDFNFNSDIIEGLLGEVLMNNMINIVQDPIILAALARGLSGVIDPQGILPK